MYVFLYIRYVFIGDFDTDVDIPNLIVKEDAWQYYCNDLCESMIIILRFIEC